MTKKYGMYLPHTYLHHLLWTHGLWELQGRLQLPRRLLIGLWL
jgi:hypothetical protein